MAIKKPIKYTDIIDKNDNDIFNREEAQVWFYYNRSNEFEDCLAEIIDRFPKELKDKFGWIRHGRGSFSNLSMYSNTVIDPRNHQDKATPSELEAIKKHFSAYGMEFIPTVNADYGIYFKINIPKSALKKLNVLSDTGEYEEPSKVKINNMKKDLALKHHVSPEQIDIYRNSNNELTYKISNIQENLQPMSAKEALYKLLYE